MAQAKKKPRTKNGAEVVPARRATSAGGIATGEARFRSLFEQSPIGIWEEDYSGAKRIVDRLRKKGVRDFRRYFRRHPEVPRQMAKAVKVIDVNPAVLDIYRAPDKETFVQWNENPARVDSWIGFYEQELAALAEGETRFALEYSDKAYDGSDIVLRTITSIGEAYKDSWARVVSTTEDITEQKRGEEARRESERRFELIMNAVPAGISYFGTDERFRWANQKYQSLLGMPPSDLIGKTLKEAIGKMPYKVAGQYAKRALKGECVSFENTLPADDGGEISIAVSYVPQFESDGTVQGFVALVNDITERTEAEKARREAEQRLADITANMPGSIFRRVLHPDGKISFPYTTIETIHGLDPKAVMEDSDVFIETIHPDDRAEWHEAVRASAERLERFDLEIRLIIPSGETKWVRSMAQPHRLANGDVVWDGVMVDITEQKRGEEALRKSEQRHRELFENSPIGIWEEDYSGAKRMIDRLRKKGVRNFRRYFRKHPEVLRQMVEAIKIIDVNRALLDIYRAPDKEAYLRAATDPSRIEQWCRFYEEELAALAEREDRVVQERPDKAFDGSDIVTRIITHVGDAYKDSWARVVSTVEDITERTEAEKARRESEERFRSLAANLPGVVFQRRLTSDGRLAYTYVSPGMRELYGIEPEKLIADSSAFLQVLPAEEQGRFLAALKHSARTLSPMDLELRVASADGGTQWQRTISRPFRRESGEVVWDGVAIDITEQKRAEAAVRESEARFRDLFEQSPIGVWEEDYSAVKPMIDRLRKKGVRDFRRYFREHPRVLRQAIDAIKIIDVNQAALDLYRVSDKETYLRAAAEPAKITQWMSFYEEQLAALAAGEGRVVQEYADRAFDGSDIVTRTVTHIGEAYKDSWARVVTTGEDITERKRAEEALRESEARLKAIVDSSPTKINLKDTKGRYVLINRRFEELYGISAKEAYGKTVYDVLPKKVADHLTALDRRVLESAATVEAETQLPLADGTHTFLTVKFPVFDAAGNVAAIGETSTDITERKRAEEALRESEERFRSIAANLPGAVFQRKLTPEGRLAYTYVSPRVRDLYGLEPQDIVADASVFLDVIPVEDRERWMAALEHSTATLSPMDLQVRVIAADGATCWVHTISHPFRRESGEVVWDGVDIDITERKRAEEALRESEARHRELFENSPIGIVEEDYSGAKRIVDRLRKKGVRDFRRYFREHPRVLRQAVEAIRIIDVNPALLDIYRVPDKEAFVQWDENPARTDSWMSFYEQELAALAAGENRFVLEYADRAFDGSDIVIRVITHIGEAYKDSWARVVSTEEDITERKRAEEKLEASEAKYQDLYDNAPDMFVSVDAKTALIWECNQTLTTNLGYTKEEIIGKPIFSVYHPDCMKDVKKAFASFVNTGEVRDTELQMKRKDGTKIEVSLNVSAVRDEQGNILYSWSSLRDITERKRAEEALRESETHFRSLFEQSPIGIAEEDYSGAKRIVDRLRKKGVRDFRRYFRKHPRVLRQMTQVIKAIDVNQALVDIYRAPDKETFVQWDVNPDRIDSWMSFYEQQLAALAEGETRFALEHADKAYDGSDIVIRIIASVGGPYKDSWARVVSTEEDITESKRIQAQLIQASKLACLGELATSVAHELNQPLNVIRMAADSLIVRITEGRVKAEFLVGKLERISQQTKRAAAIIKHMRIFGHMADEKPRLLDPRAPVREALNLLEPQFRLRGISVSTKFPENCRKVLGQSIQIEQVLLDLLINARDAIETKFMSSGEHDGAAKREITLTVEDDLSSDKLKIIISDTGCGIPEDVIDRIFEPFFTTKESGTGTGLGLSITHGIITDMGGTVEAANIDGGAQITISLTAAAVDEAEMALAQAN